MPFNYDKKTQIRSFQVCCRAGIAAIPAKAATTWSGKRVSHREPFRSMAGSEPIEKRTGENASLHSGRYRRDWADTTNVFASDARLLLKFPVGQNAGPSFVIRSMLIAQRRRFSTYLYHAVVN